MNYLDVMRAESELYREFPVCVGEMVPADNKTTTPKKADTKQ
jgi:hypothetical protein